jgi:hypothetical protein
MATTEPIDLSRWRDNGGMVRINHSVLMHKLAVRGKAPAALREAHVSYDILAKIKRGELVSPRAFRKIVVQLAAWPELDHAADLLS